MNHLFISYSRKDETLVSAVVQKLRAEGMEVWQDISGKTSGIPYSTKWFAAIEEALYTSDGAVMFCSEAWHKSAPCAKEQKLIDELAIPALSIDLTGDASDESRNPDALAERIALWARENVFGQELNELRSWLLSSVHACSMQKGRYTGIPRYKKRRDSKAFLTRLEQSNEAIDQLGFAEKSPSLYNDIQNFLKTARQITVWDYWKKPLAILLVVAILGAVAFVSESYGAQKRHAEQNLVALQAMKGIANAMEYDEAKALLRMAQDEYDYSEYTSLLFEKYADVLDREYPAAFYPAESMEAQAIAALPEQDIADDYGLEFDESRGAAIVDFALEGQDYRPTISLQLGCAPSTYAYADGYLALAAAQRVYVFDLAHGYAPRGLSCCYRDVEALRFDGNGRICAITAAGDVYVWENPIARITCSASEIPAQEALPAYNGFEVIGSSTGLLQVRDTKNDCVVWQCSDITEPIESAFLDATDWTVYAQGKSGTWYAADASRILANYTTDMAKQRENYRALGEEIVNRLIYELCIVHEFID